MSVNERYPIDERISIFLTKRKILHAYVNLSELILIHKELTSQTSTALMDEILEKDLSY